MTSLESTLAFQLGGERIFVQPARRRRIVGNTFKGQNSFMGANASGTYRMSFSTGGLNLLESLMVAAEFERLRDWDAVSREVVSSGLLQTRTQNSAKRTVLEIVLRLRTLSDQELSVLLTGARPEQASFLWLAACRAYPFLGEFAAEFLNERYLAYRRSVENQDFDSFLEAKAEWHPQVAKLSDATRQKLRQVAFRMMREADIISADGTILAAILTPNVQASIADEADLRFFPGFDRRRSGRV
jgi:hypothetical protein